MSLSFWQETQFSLAFAAIFSFGKQAEALQNNLTS